MRYVAAFLLIVVPRVGVAQEVRPPATVDAGMVDAAIERGLDFLVKDALAWKAKHKCVSCHHAGMVVWSLREAQRRGFAVDEPVQEDLRTWLLEESGDGRTGVPRPKGLPKALNAKAVWFGLALGAEPRPNVPAQSVLKQLWKTVKSDQVENGSWVAWPETRAPIFGDSDGSMTALAALALLPAAAEDDEAALALERAVHWLTTKGDDDPQTVAIRLVMWKKLGRPAEEWTPLVRRIQERQNPDGGWAQAKDMASDAWATGQALYALAHAGMTAKDGAIARGQEFLVKTQRADGGWTMTSRPTTPGGKGATSLIPITGAGSAWGVLGLVRSRN